MPLVIPSKARIWNADRKTIGRWLYIATCARFVSLFTYIKEQAECEKVKDLEAFVEYHYEAYQGLLQ